MISETERGQLLAIARASVEAEVVGQRHRISADVDEPGWRAGAFVTIHQHGELRGCIGHIEADQPVADVVRRCAAAACSSDPRFPAVTPAELPSIELELSILGPLQPVTAPADIEVGRDGLVVELGYRRGLLLPQVAAERGWDTQTFVEQTCRKAGLPADAWQHGARVWKFQAEVFS